jgi:lipoprotein NlpD
MKDELKSGARLLWQARSRVCLRLLSLGCLSTIAACANNYDAPIEHKPAFPSASRPTAQSTVRTPAGGPAERERPTPAVHVVASGDKLLTIAWRYGLDVRDLIRWNQITNPDLIVIGQTLRLRPVTPPSAVAARVPGASAAPPILITPSASSAAGREATPATAATSTSPRLSLLPSPVPPDAALANPAVSAASTNKPQGSVMSSASTPAGNNKANTPDEGATAAKEGVRWMWPTQGNVSAADSGAASKGIDIRGARGQAVKAAAAGAVVYSGSGLRGYGELIIIKHSDTFLSAYAHNEVRLVQEGRRVAAGESIARMGNSDTTDVMLHFEIRRNGKSIDPLQYLPKR